LRSSWYYKQYLRSGEHEEILREKNLVALYCGARWQPGTSARDVEDRSRSTYCRTGIGVQIYVQPIQEHTVVV
jgi:hypothetical protein